MANDSRALLAVTAALFLDPRPQIEQVEGAWGEPPGKFHPGRLPDDASAARGRINGDLSDHSDSVNSAIIDPILRSEGGN